MLAPLFRRYLTSRGSFPSGPTWSIKKLIPKECADDGLLVSEDTVEHVERLSLLKDPDTNLSPEEEKTRLDSLKFYVRFAEQLKEVVNKENIEPLYSLFQDSSLSLNQSESRDALPVQDVTGNSRRTEQGYFVAPLPTWYHARKQAKKS
jgi:aspartyl/glutamyl-tRNA(Asn/Gln) amidotransferase C subunit